MKATVLEVNMMRIKAKTIGVGEAKEPRRCIYAYGWTVAKYAVLTVCGILLYRAGAAYALAERGYIAVGGEVFFLFLPLFHLAFSTMIRDTIRDAKGHRATRKEDCEHE